MARIKAGKKIRSAINTFARQKTKRVQAVTGAISDIVASRQAGRAAVAQAKAAGGGFIGRQEAVGQIGTGFIDVAGKLGMGAATGGASLAGGALSGLLGGMGRGDMAFDTGSGQVVSTTPKEEPFYTQPIFLIGAVGLAALLLLRPRNGRR